MMKWLAIVAVLAGVSGIVLGTLAAKYEPRYSPGVRVGEASLAGLTPQQAEQVVRELDQQVRSREIILEAKELRKPGKWTAEQLGVGVDVKATLAAARPEGFWESLWRRAGIAKPTPRVVEPVLISSGEGLDEVAGFVSRAQYPPRKATAKLVGGVVVRTPEGSSVALDKAKLQQELPEIVAGAGKGPMPLVRGPKHVPDAELAKITDVMTTFQTRFSASNANRTHNIKLAAEKFNGLVLMPGEKASFNTVVGQRTAKNGFKVAGVYVLGRHDFDFGGGICQVSTTLYNAALLSNMKIVSRRAHGLPVSYVPLGRDATVNWGSIDLVIQNNYEFPVALSTSFVPGRLAISVLGKKDPSLKVEIERGPIETWDNGVKIVKDASLPPGKEVVVEKGAIGRKTTTFRLVYNGDVLAKREALGVSYYSGSKRIVAKNPSPAAPKPTPEAATKPEPKPQGEADEESELRVAETANRR